MDDRDFENLERIRSSKKEKPELTKILNKKDFDQFELDMLMNEAE